MSVETTYIMVYMWIAFYDNNECFPQFDLETGKLNMFGDVDQSRVQRFGLFPITEELAAKINQVNDEATKVESKQLPYFILKLNEGQRLIYVRRAKIHQYTIYICTKCGYEWQDNADEKTKIGEAGFPIHRDHITQKLQNGQVVDLPLCPKCGSTNYLMCPDCNEAINKNRKLPTDPWYWDCPKCKKEYPRMIGMGGGIKRECAYVIGYQQTKNENGVPVNRKYLLIVSKDGTFEIADQ